MIIEVSIYVDVFHSHVCYAFLRMWTFFWLKNKLLHYKLLQLSQT